MQDMTIMWQVMLICSGWPLRAKKKQYLASNNGDFLASNCDFLCAHYLPINNHYRTQDMAILWQVMLICSVWPIHANKWPYRASSNGDLFASNCDFVLCAHYLPINHHYLMQDMAIIWQVMLIYSGGGITRH